MDLNLILEGFVNGEAYKAILQFIGAASILAALTPNQMDNQALRLVKIILDALGANFLHAKNQVGPPAPKK